MEPLLPAQQGAQLAELSKALMLKIGRISGQVHSPLVREKIAALVREMNCYYSNLIEGHKALPRDIERALRKDYSSDPVKRDNQKLSQAHIQVETLMLERLIAIAAAHQRLAWIHPFGDGLWTLSRGLARYKERYYTALETADQARQGDRDGRGNLLSDHSTWTARGRH